MFLRPFGLYCSACFGSLFVSILCTWCNHFSWYCFIIVLCVLIFVFRRHTERQNLWTECQRAFSEFNLVLNFFVHAILMCRCRSKASSKTSTPYIIYDNISNPVRGPSFPTAFLLTRILTRRGELFTTQHISLPSSQMCRCVRDRLRDYCGPFRVVQQNKPPNTVHGHACGMCTSYYCYFTTIQQDLLWEWKQI